MGGSRFGLYIVRPRALTPAAYRLFGLWGSISAGEIQHVGKPVGLDAGDELRNVQRARVLRVDRDATDEDQGVGYAIRRPSLSSLRRHRYF